jgi:sarcosine oxidase
MSTHDVIVLGLGAMGSASAAELSSRGRRVLGLDRHRPPHTKGSSHGETRVIREAYWEHPLYVPLVQRATELWRRLEHDSGRSLLRTTGALLIGSESGPLITGSRRAADEHGLEWHDLSADQIRHRFPTLRPGPATVGLLEPRAGALFPESCIESQLAKAAVLGADLHFDEPVTAWSACDGTVEVETARGRYSAGHLVICSGAWLPGLVAGLPLEIERQVLHWFEPDDRRAFEPENFPVFLFEEPDGRHWYGLPDFGSGLKVAIHHHGAITDPDALDREIGTEDVASMRELVERRLIGVDRAPSRSVTCMYTNTPDGHFLVDFHPEHPEVVLVSPCSGHGFKFAPAIGEIAADLVTETGSTFDLTPFRHSRLASSTDEPRV